jgi:aspartate/methionine/tyrosine aminotransferase
MEERIVELKEKRDLALGIVRSIPGVRCPTPMGAFYIMPEVSNVEWRGVWCGVVWCGVVWCGVV